MRIPGFLYAPVSAAQETGAIGRPVRARFAAQANGLPGGLGVGRAVAPVVPVVPVEAIMAGMIEAPMVEARMIGRVGQEDAPAKRPLIVPVVVVVIGVV